MVDGGAGAGLGEFDRHDPAMEAEQRRKEKEARKRKKKKQTTRREREKARQEAERAAAGDGGGPQALDVLGVGDVGSGGDDDEFSSPLSSGRGPNDGGLDGLYDEVFSGTTDTSNVGGGGGVGGGVGGGGRGNEGLDGFRSMSKKPPPARLPTLGGGGGLPGLPETVGSRPCLATGTGRPTWLHSVTYRSQRSVASVG